MGELLKILTIKWAGKTSKSIQNVCNLSLLMIYLAVCSFYRSSNCQNFRSQNSKIYTLCERVERFLPELFVFVAIPGVPAHNNLAERSVRPLVVARKISGGTRSPKGSQTRMGLASLFGTWMAQHLNPFHQYLALLTSSSSLGQV